MWFLKLFILQTFSFFKYFFKLEKLENLSHLHQIFINKEIWNINKLKRVYKTNLSILSLNLV